MLTRVLLIFILLGTGCGVALTGPDPSEQYIRDGIPLGHYRIFIRDETGTTNLGGVVGANALCRASAQTAGLVLDYRALLSTSTTDAKDLFTTNAPLWQVKADGQRVLIKALTSLLWTEQSVETQIKFDARGNEVADLLNTVILTGTSSDGTASWDGSAFRTCSDWTSDVAGTARLGRPNFTNGLWISQAHINCNTLFVSNLYCFALNQ